MAAIRILEKLEKEFKDEKLKCNIMIPVSEYGGQIRFYVVTQQIQIMWDETPGSTKINKLSFKDRGHIKWDIFDIDKTDDIIQNKFNKIKQIIIKKVNDAKKEQKIIKKEVIKGDKDINNNIVIKENKDISNDIVIKVKNDKKDMQSLIGNFVDEEINKKDDTTINKLDKTFNKYQDNKGKRGRPKGSKNKRIIGTKKNGTSTKK